MKLQDIYRVQGLNDRLVELKREIEHLERAVYFTVTGKSTNGHRTEVLFKDPDQPDVFKDVPIHPAFYEIKEIYRNYLTSEIDRVIGELENLGVDVRDS